MVTMSLQGMIRLTDDDDDDDDPSAGTAMKCGLSTCLGGSYNEILEEKGRIMNFCKGGQTIHQRWTISALSTWALLACKSKEQLVLLEVIDI